MSVTPVAHATDALEAVKARPHWHVVLEPGEFRERRVQSLDECWRLLESCRVALRERDHPHIYDDNRQNGDHWIASWGRFNGQEGYWRFFQSGQFVHRLTFFEDTLVELGAERFHYVDYLEVLKTVTEVFEFAARLAQRGAFGDFVSVTVEMQQIRDRKLAIRPRGLYAFEPCGPAAEPTLKDYWEGSTVALIAGSAELARNLVVSFFVQGFGYRPSPEVLLHRQRGFLERA